MRQIRKMSQSLAVQLTDRERLEFADAFASAGMAEDAEAARIKSVMEGLKEGLRDKQAETTRLRTIVFSRSEYRMTDVFLLADDAAGRMIEMRADTGEEISNREQRAEERQKDLDLTGSDAPLLPLAIRLKLNLEKGKKADAEASSATKKKAPAKKATVKAPVKKTPVKKGTVGDVKKRIVDLDSEGNTVPVSGFPVAVADPVKAVAS